MPILTKLYTQNFRNLSRVEIFPSSSVNLFFGENGSGKTSILESISVLAHARSFRTHKYRHLVKKDQPEFTVFGEIASQLSDEIPIKIGVQRNRTTKNIAKINGNKVKTAIELAQVMPLKVIDSHSFELLEGSSSQRRRVLDWLVFHVEPLFKDSWIKYAKCIKHRNQLLRNDKVQYSELQPWDEQIVVLAEQINIARKNCLEILEPVFNTLLNEFNIGMSGNLSMKYNSGWAGEETAQGLKEVLFKEFTRDKVIGRTAYGPHRSDFSVKIDNTAAIEILSRGQQKSVITALHIAQAMVFKNINNKTPIFLIDDMTSELDEKNTERLFTWLSQLGSQLFITGVEAHKLKSKWLYNSNLSQEDVKVFHVKQGLIEESTRVDETLAPSIVNT